MLLLILQTDCFLFAAAGQALEAPATAPFYLPANLSWDPVTPAQVPLIGQRVSVCVTVAVSPADFVVSLSFLMRVMLTRLSH